MLITLVVAMDEADLIGKGGDLPWRLPADLAHFKKLTMGKPIVMGRRTWESIGRPLPGRDNVVLTRDRDFAAEGVIVLHHPEDVGRRFADRDEVCIIGGAEVYRLFLPLAGRIQLTRVHGRFPGDTWFTEFDPDQWCETACRHREADEKNPCSMSFITLERKS